MGQPKPQLRIDFVSDVACPWCAVGLASLEQALARLGADIDVALHFQPFELNPGMADGGQDAGDYLKAKYGMDDAQLHAARVRIREAGAAAGFSFSEKRERVWNTFDAHRLLHWAGLVEAGGSPQAQHALKKALLTAYHARNENPGAPEVLLAAAREAGLDAAQAQAVIDSDRYTADVQQMEAFWQQSGIQSVPAIVINRQHLISGGQPSGVFEAALRQVALG
jgi:predicted DsbA family dithiol-disulfide isomerase